MKNGFYFFLLKNFTDVLNLIYFAKK